MTYKLNNKVADRQLVFDGNETDWYNFSMRKVLTNQESIDLSFGAIRERKFEVENNYLIEEQWRYLKTLCKIDNNNFFGVYVNKNGIQSYAEKTNFPDKTNQYLVISSSGEVQPARYQIWIEGIWTLTESII